MNRRDGHLYVFLEGFKDKLWQRAQIYTNAGGKVEIVTTGDGSRPEDYEVIDLQPAICQGCTEPHQIDWISGQWHHNSDTKGGRRCDCQHCALYVCKRWHEAFHNRVIKIRRLT